MGFQSAHARKTAEAQSLIAFPIGERKEAEAGIRDDAAKPLEEFVRLGARAQEGEELHDRGIGIDLVEEVAVLLIPVPEYEARGGGGDHQGVTNSDLRSPCR